MWIQEYVMRLYFHLTIIIWYWLKRSDLKVMIIWPQNHDSPRNFMKALFVAQLLFQTWNCILKHSLFKMPIINFTTKEIIYVKEWFLTTSSAVMGLPFIFVIVYALQGFFGEYSGFLLPSPRFSIPYSPSPTLLVSTCNLIEEVYLCKNECNNLRRGLNFAHRFRFWGW